MAMASFVLGLVSFFGAFVPFLNFLTLIAAVLGFIFGIIQTVMGKTETDEDKKKRGISIAGLTLSAIAIPLTMAMITLFLIAANNGGVEVFTLLMR